MQFFTPNFYIVVIASYAWLLVHGLPTLIYLFLNRTIRADFIAMLRMATSKIGLAKRSTDSRVNPVSLVQ